MMHETCLYFGVVGKPGDSAVDKDRKRMSVKRFDSIGKNKKQKILKDF